MELTKVKLTKEDARAIWLQKYYSSLEFNFNSVIHQNKKPKIKPYKESFIALEGKGSDLFQSTEEYDYLEKLSEMDWNSFISKVRLAGGNILPDRGDRLENPTTTNPMEQFVIKARECARTAEEEKQYSSMYSKDPNIGIWKGYEWTKSTDDNSDDEFFFSSEEEIDNYIKKINEMINEFQKKYPNLMTTLSNDDMDILL